jgi:hypothetical protein
MPNVTVTPPAVIQVRVGTPTPPTVAGIGAGTNRLHNAADLNLNGLADGDVISYQANTSNFIVINAGSLPLNIPGLDGGTF